MGSLSTVLNFEGHNLTFLENESGVKLLRATDLCAPMGDITKQAVLKKVSGLADEDRCQVKVDTLGGPQEVTFLTPSGALQVMATGRSKQCGRLRKVVCDFYVAQRAPESQVSPDLLAVIREGIELRRELLRLEKLITRRSPHDHGPHTFAIQCQMEREGFYKSAAYLLKFYGERQTGALANSVTNQAKAIVKKNGCRENIQRFGRWGEHIYFHKSVLSMVVADLPSGQLALEAAERLIADPEEGDGYE